MWHVEVNNLPLKKALKYFKQHLPHLSLPVNPFLPAPFAEATSPDSLGPPSPLENFLSMLDRSTTSDTENQFFKDLHFQYETACDRESREFEQLSQIQCNQHYTDEIMSAVSNVERCFGKNYIKQIHYREETAILLAKHYCDQLIIDLQSEKIKAHIAV